MRLGVSLLTLALALAAGTSPAAAQLPLPLPDVLKTVEETTKKVVEDTKKAVEDTERVVREVVDRTVDPGPTPGGGGPDDGPRGGGPGGGGPDDGPRGGGPGDDDDSGGGGPGDDGSGGGPGGGSGGNGGSTPGTKDAPAAPDGAEYGAEGNAILAVSRPRASSDDERSAPADGAGTEALRGDSRDVQPGIAPAVAAKAGPFVLAVLALALMCLVVGTGGGLRALYGRLRDA